MGDAGARGEDVEYQAVMAAPEWWRAGVDAIPWVPLRSGGRVVWYVKEGPCPRCHHPDGIRVTKEALTYRVLDIPRPDPPEIWVACSCGRPHRNRPDGESGCGFGGLVAAPVPVEDDA